MSSVGTVAVAGLRAHWAVSPALPTEPQCLGSHYLDKYICPVDQPTGPVSSSAPPRDAITALITLSRPRDKGWAGITRAQISLSSLLG